ncbi:pyruvate, phosphate dikinase [Gemmatimonas sp.]|uniref:pyruvate, phosphate dikinase n=1 Tax=Gemmatimonas sp. TaxID=1962908 RepID=UPI0025BEC986|nr:pyruvate, phosphate dikinase [Gemmatimonas sp.]MCA2982396.1 pyruvate, phosphate dikinase [Gemmatimonas sp.]MCA2994135.1 pyruvate, phosphate dikinase [Gemmatimonas sp.]MCE2952328.1 pyruvate, phosphate dikinase [Gemmatimonas sp.]
MTRSVYFFGNGTADGTREMKSLLGGKGANLAEMTNLGVPVPPGFTIAADQCVAYLEHGGISDTLRSEVEAALVRLETVSGKRFGDPANPLLVSVRSGAAVSMPGMMETILNLGLNDETVEGLAAASGNARFAFDSYRRFVQMYADVVLGVNIHRFEQLLATKRLTTGVSSDAELSAEALRTLVTEYQQLVRAATGADFPSDPQVQLWGAIEAVWKSWTLKKAVDYRKVNGIPHTLGTGVNIVSMVFGNRGSDSGTGVAFTRDPSTGERRFYGEFLVNAQGEDVVAGIRTPLHIDEMATQLPGAYEALLETQGRLERHFRDMQDIEFTVERGTLYLLQTRTGKRTTAAALRIALDMVEEGLISEREAVLRLQPNQLDQLLHRVIASTSQATPIAVGLPASPGAASGVAVFDPDVAERRHHQGEQVILVREETTPEDFHGIVAARAVLTARGGMTSHAAVVARGMGKCAIVGCTAMDILSDQRSMRVGEVVVTEGDWLTLDGGTGRVFLGDLPTQPSEVMRVINGLQPASEAPTYRGFATLMGWADTHRRLKVRANADTPRDARVARNFGAEGIGLCRTEHMFFEGDRITAMREMIVARDEGGRRRALEKLLPMQRTDFEGIFEAMDGHPVTIRLLDPPLHEFLPHGGEESSLLAASLNLSRPELSRIVSALRETNPMLGHRGCRLGIVYPEITEMQARAIFEAAVRACRRGIEVLPEIMVPLVSDVTEFRHQRAIIERAADQVMGVMGERVPYLVGTMIELPRAALTADEIAAEADFFSFGTNDLTQTTFGLSRDDAGRFLPQYVEGGIFPDDPFQVLDAKGVGKLVKWAVRDGRETKPSLKVGICGEHGGEPRSVAFCHTVGLDYVSCSPFRVPVARLAAAHAALHD